MDEVKLKKIRFLVTDLALWESFLSDVLDLSLAPTEEGLRVESSGICFELKAGASSEIEWEFSLPPSEREIILSRWSFYQYRAEGSMSLVTKGDELFFQIDDKSKVVINFDSFHACESPEDLHSTVRIF